MNEKKKPFVINPSYTFLFDSLQIEKYFHSLLKKQEMSFICSIYVFMVLPS